MDKEYKKFVIVFISYLGLISIMVIIMILANKGFIPAVFQTIALVCFIICAVVFNIFSSKYRKGR